MTSNIPVPPMADLHAALDHLDQEFRDAPDERHVERLTLTAAIISEAFLRVGCRTVLVGGGAIEFYAPDAYLTQDVDLVVEGAPGTRVRDRISQVFTALGFSKLSGRHWERGGLLVEIPGYHIDEPYTEVVIGPYHLNVIRLEVVLVGRVVEFDQTGHTGHAAQAILLLRAIGETLDRDMLMGLLRREHAEAAFAVLDGVAQSGCAISDALLRNLHDRLHARGQYAPGYISTDPTDIHS